MSTQRRRRQAASDDDSEPEARRGLRNNGADESGDDAHASGAEGGDVQLAKKLVRYALSCEYSRTIIRREGIKDKVLGTHSRAFRRVFELAQTQLRDVFGMELRELPVKEKLTLQEKRQAMKSNAQIKVGSGTYILISTLPDEYRVATIIPPSKTPNKDNEAAYTGFYTTIISIIMLSGGEISEQRLRRYLTRMNADQNAVGDKTDSVLARMQKQGYVVRKVERLAGSDEEQVSWLVGPRGKEEVGAEGVAGMVREVFAGPNTTAKSRAALERQIRSSLNMPELGSEVYIKEAEPSVEPGPSRAAPAAGGSRRRRRRDDDGDD